MTTDLILGTAGHIDHGKTSLIRELTGVDTDRLPEERRRGITIDLGFAELCVGEFRLGIVDVPGHERFVRNMLAGATGMDLAMLVVAADDSVKTQTREHLEILRLLDLPAGVIVLTKSDLVEADWLEMVREEIRGAVRGCFLEAAPIVATSIVRKTGFEELKARLSDAAGIAAASKRMRSIDAPFRMPIDRIFTMPGHGAVVTGSVSSGRLQVGDELVIQPEGMAVRVRGLQNHDQTVDEVHRGQRAAINLAGLHHEEIHRGHELATPGHLVPSRLLTAAVQILPSAARPLKARSRVRLHLGTSEILATVRLLEGSSLAPGKAGFAQFFLSEEACTVWNQPFVVRSESPVMTIGGGHVLDPNAEKLPQVDTPLLQRLTDLQSPDEITRAAAALYFANLRDWQPRDLARTAGIQDWLAAYESLTASGELLKIGLSHTRTLRVHRRRLEELADRIAAALRTIHGKQPLRPMLDRNQLAAGFAYLGDPAILNAVLEQMARDQQIRLTDKGIALAGEGPKLSQNERKLLGELIEVFRQAGIASPTVAECQQGAARNQQSVPQLIALAAAAGDLVEIAQGYYLHAEVEAAVREQLRQAFAAAGHGMTMSEIRETLGTTRKFAVPLCEYFDRSGFTKRQGDLRMLGSREAASEPAAVGKS